MNNADSKLAQIIAHSEEYDNIVIVSYTPLLLLQDQRKPPGKIDYYNNIMDRIDKNKKFTLYASYRGLKEQFLRMNDKKKRDHLEEWKKLLPKIKKNVKIKIVDDIHLPSISCVFTEKNGEDSIEGSFLEIREGITNDQLFLDINTKTFWISPEEADFPAVKTMLNYLKNNSDEFSNFISKCETEYIYEYDICDNFFTNLKGNLQHVIFLQLDIANHSKWFGDQKTDKVKATLYLKRFANKITHELIHKDFHKMFWAGDGGMFVTIKDDSSKYDETINAADKIFEIFDQWHTENKIPSSVHMRVSAHAANDVFTYNDPSLWTSDDLNWFAKNERDIAKPYAGNIVITEQMTNLTKYKSRFQSCKTKVYHDKNKIKLFFAKPSY